MSFNYYLYTVAMKNAAVNLLHISRLHARKVQKNCVFNCLAQQLGVLFAVG